MQHKGKCLRPIVIGLQHRAIRYIFFFHPKCHLKKKDAAPVPFAKKERSRPYGSENLTSQTFPLLQPSRPVFPQPLAPRVEPTIRAPSAIKNPKLAHKFLGSYKIQFFSGQRPQGIIRTQLLDGNGE